jgi:ethanolamine utilization protein EutM
MPTDHAIGLIETRGIVALTAGIEAMIKTADVRCIAVERIGSGYLAAAVQGSLAAVRQAVEAATVAVRQYGDLRAAQVYPKPHEVSAGLLDGNSSRQLRQAITAADDAGNS